MRQPFTLLNLLVRLVRAFAYVSPLLSSSPPLIFPLLPHRQTSKAASAPFVCLFLSILCFPTFVGFVSRTRVRSRNGEKPHFNRFCLYYSVFSKKKTKRHRKQRPNALLLPGSNEAVLRCSVVQRNNNNRYLYLLQEIMNSQSFATANSPAVQVGDDSFRVLIFNSDATNSKCTCEGVRDDPREIGPAKLRIHWPDLVVPGLLPHVIVASEMAQDGVRTLVIGAGYTCYTARDEGQVAIFIRNDVRSVTQQRGDRWAQVLVQVPGTQHWVDIRGVHLPRGTDKTKSENRKAINKDFPHYQMPAVSRCDTLVLGDFNSAQPYVIWRFDKTNRGAATMDRRVVQGVVFDVSEAPKHGNRTDFVVHANPSPWFHVCGTWTKNECYSHYISHVHLYVRKPAAAAAAAAAGALAVVQQSIRVCATARAAAAAAAAAAAVAVVSAVGEGAASAQTTSPHTPALDLHAEGSTPEQQRRHNGATDTDDASSSASAVGRGEDERPEATESCPVE